MQGTITLFDIISAILIFAGFILVGLAFLHLGLKRKNHLLKTLFGISIAFGVLFYLLKLLLFIGKTQILIAGELTYELGMPAFSLDFFVLKAAFISISIIFGVYLLTSLDDSKVFSIITISLAFSAAALAFLGIFFYFINPFTIYIQYVILSFLSQWIGMVFLIFVLIWFVKQKPSVTTDEKVKDIQAPKPLEKNLALEDRLLKASKVYTRIPYKKLAKLLNCKTRELLDLVTELVSDDRLEATIEEPDIIFQH